MKREDKFLDKGSQDRYYIGGNYDKDGEREREREREREKEKDLWGELRIHLVWSRIEDRKEKE